MNLEDEIGKASAIMTRYRMTKEDQIAVVKRLIDVGVERCLQEQERIRLTNESMIEHAQSHPLYRGRPN
jgi:hypothetical protein